MSKKIILTLGVCALLYVAFTLAANAETVVKWDSLEKLDVLAERCQALSDANDAAELRKLVIPVRAAMGIVAADRIPVGAKAPDQVKILQTELTSLIEALNDSGTQVDVELISILTSIDPIVGKMMEAAGMPHVHKNDDQADEPTKEKHP